MSDARERNRILRYVIVVAVIVLTGLDVVGSSPQTAWIFGLLVLVVVVIFLVREKPWKRKLGS